MCVGQAAHKTKVAGQGMKLRWCLPWITTYPLARLILKLRVSGRDRLARGAQILACNHVSNIDPVVVSWAAAREVHFLGKEELFRHSRVSAWIIKTWNTWPVRRGIADMAAIRHCKELLRHRQTLVLFPEGTRSQDGTIHEFKPGVGMIAVDTGTPVVPTLLFGMDRSWISYATDRDFVRRGFRVKPKRVTPIEVRFGEPVDSTGFSRSREGYAEMTRLVEDRVRELRKVT